MSRTEKAPHEEDSSSVHLEAKPRIRHAAARLWAERGYHGVGIEELSRSVALQRGSLYHHIGSKEELLFDILRGSMERLIESSRRSLDQPDALATIRALSRALLLDISSHRAEWVIFFSDGKVLGTTRLEAIHNLRDEYENLWLQAVEKGVRSGELRPVDPIVVKALLGMHNYAFVWLQGGGRLSPTELSDHFVEVLYRGVASGSS